MKNKSAAYYAYVSILFFTVTQKLGKIAIFQGGLYAFLSIPVWALAATVEGTVQGFQCVQVGKTCLVNKKDPVAAFEHNFVILTPSGAYYLVPNLDRAVLARH